MTDTRLTKDELRSLLAISPKAGGEIRLKGKRLPWKPFSVADYLRFVVARFKSARAFFVMTMETATIAAQVKAITDKRPLTVDEEFEFDERRERLEQDYLVANAIDQVGADAATLALGLGFPGDEEVESWLIESDEEEFELALRTVEDGSWGQDPERFFGVLGKKLYGRTMQTIASARARTSEKSKASSTPPKQPSKARPAANAKPNRKSRRATRATTGT